MCDTPPHGSDHLWLIWKESIQNWRCYRADTAGGTDGRTDGQTDRRTEWNQYTPQQLCCSGGITRRNPPNFQQDLQALFSDAPICQMDPWVPSRVVSLHTWKGRVFIHSKYVTEIKTSKPHRNFAHVTTALLSWHVQNSDVAIVFWLLNIVKWF